MKMIKKFLHNYQYKLALRKKLLLSYLLISLILIGTFSGIVLWYSTSFVGKLLLNSATETFDQTTTALTNIFNTYEQITMGIARSYTFDDLMEQDLSDYTADQQISVKLDFERALFSFLPTHIKNTSYGVTMKVYFNDGFNYFVNGSRYFSFEAVGRELWFQNIIEQYMHDRTGFFVIPASAMDPASPEAAGLFSMIRVIVDMDYYPHPLALLRLDVSTDYLNNLITLTTLDNSLNGVFSQDFSLLALSDRTEVSLYQKFQKDFRIDTLEESTWIPLELDGTDYLVRCTTVVPYGLKQFSILTRESVYSNLDQLQAVLLVVALIMLIFCLPLARFISGVFTSRLLKVIDTMKLVTHGELVPCEDKVGTDEVGELITSYNYMVDQMQHMIQLEYAHGQKIKSAELRALQAQINPHFLYNTLDMMHWFSEEGMVSEIGKSVNALATFYRISLSNGREIITIREELKHVSAYMELQNLRFRNSISYSCDADSSLMNCLIVKTTLQPIIENAIQHGIMENDPPEGEIRLNMYTKDNNIEIIITDNGVGMDEAGLNDINKGIIEPKPGHGYGVHNVQSRLQLFYGMHYGLTYESNPGGGTRVRILIPQKLTN